MKTASIDLIRDYIVFLRLLEYYSGILFLTTNRVGTLDAAFRSRIHVSLYYPPLTRTQAVQIFRNNLERLKRLRQERADAQQPILKFNADQLARFFSKRWDSFRWNGRQIRNAFQTAVALAEFEVRQSPEQSPRITKKHFEQVAKVAREFEYYLKIVHRASEADMAHRRSERADVPSAEEVKELKKKQEKQKRKIQKQEMEKEAEREKKRDKKKTSKTRKHRRAEEDETSDDSDSSEDSSGEPAREVKGKKAAAAELSESSDEKTSDTSDDTTGSESEESRAPAEKKTKEKHKSKSKKSS